METLWHIDVVEVTATHTAVESTIAPSHELISYTDKSGYSTGLKPKSMAGGGR
jgi:hypothetical protein